MFNILGQCHRLYISRFFSVEILADLFAAVTGIEITAGDLKKTAERVWNMWKLMNHRVGFDRSNDTPPGIWFQPIRGEDRDYPLMDYYHRKVLLKEDVDRLIDDYCDEHGWEKRSGTPLPETLKELGIERYASDFS